MRALRPKSASATTAALMWEVGGGPRIINGSGGFSAEASLDHPDDRVFLRVQGRAGPGGAGARLDRPDRGAIHVGIENRRMDVTLPTHGLRVAEPFGNRFDRFHDVAFRLGIRSEPLNRGERLCRQNGTRPGAEVLGGEVLSAD